MKTLHYRDCLISCYAIHLCKELAKAEVREREAYISKLDSILKYDGESRLVMLPEHVAFQQGSDDGPSPEIEHEVHFPNHG